MILTKAEVGPFKSIDTPQAVNINPNVTVLVGMNEAGKTVFLQALEKANDALGVAQYNLVEDYPRKDLRNYSKLHKTKPAQVAKLTFRLSEQEVEEINNNLHTNLPSDFEFSMTHKYDNKIGNLYFSVDEQPVIEFLISNSNLSSDAVDAIRDLKTIREIPEALKGLELTAKDKEFITQIEERISKTHWDKVSEFEVWSWLKPKTPKLVYFGEYEILPSKMNLPYLSQVVEQAEEDPTKLKPEHRGVLALLRMADIDITDFTNSGGYETLKAKIEAVSINLTDQIMEFWKQNENLEVEVDIKPDESDEPPFNDGPNLYLRIKNRRHRGVSTPFRQRSRGFVWFFSFLVWFDNVQNQLEMEGNQTHDLILLLDEPGLNLHALAQRDFLSYLDELSERHQVIYTTHSPFMVNSDRLQDVRVVEDRPDFGTHISDDLTGSDPRTLFPLQAALGYTIAQNLNISKRNLLVEGIADLVFLKYFSGALEKQGREYLREDITIVPAGGLDKVATFIALLKGNDLDMCVLHDYESRPDPRLEYLVREKLIRDKQVLNYAMFRDLVTVPATTGSLVSTDVEDLISLDLYLKLFNATYKRQLSGVEVTEPDLPPGDRVVNRISKFLEVKTIVLRKSGGYNHYLIANHLASNPIPPSKMDVDTLQRFENIFKSVNSLLP